MFRDNFVIISILPTALDRPYCMVEDAVGCGASSREGVLTHGRTQPWSRPPSLPRPSLQSAYRGLRQRTLLPTAVAGNKSYTTAPQVLFRCDIGRPAHVGITSQGLPPRHEQHSLVKLRVNGKGFSLSHNSFFQQSCHLFFSVNRSKLVW